MLDLASVKRQINQMVQEQKDAQNRFLKRMKLVSAEFERWSGDWETLADKVSLSKTSWPVAGISEPLNGSYPPPERPKQLTVIATDGSQIFPDRHEISSCYLINIGFVAIHYGTGERPTLSSRPFLFYKDQDLHRDWAGKRTFMSNEIFAMKREALEFSELALLAEGSRSEGRTAVALSDGTLILWPLEGVPTDFKATTLEGFLSSLDRLRETQIPLAGYISQPGSTDVINSLRVGLCPEESPNCDKCPWKDIAYESQRRSKLPCAAIEGVTDQILFSHILREGERSALFYSSSRILEEYGPHHVFFFYVNVGSEIARVEVPQWVAEESRLVDLVHSCVCDQSEKGEGYPIALSEAHEKAVVRGRDRDIFYRFLRDSFVQHDIRARISSKSMKKLGPTV